MQTVITTNANDWSVIMQLGGHVRNSYLFSFARHKFRGKYLVGLIRNPQSKPTWETENLFAHGVLL
jgi:hypothetical protein